MRIQVFFLGLAALVMVGLLAVWLNYSRVQAGYRISELRMRKEALEETKKSLECRVSSLRSSDAVEDRIRKMQLGLQYPSRAKVGVAFVSAERRRN
ncbi:MAG: hypothetical protein V1809_05910 [Planctomycetota bacterium]